MTWQAIFAKPTSNSPRYLVSASNIPSCRLMTRLSFSRSGTFPSTISCAKPKIMVL